MKVLIVNVLYPPHKIGGAEKSVSLLAEALVRAGDEVVVATLDDIDHCVHPHPAIPEAVQECARMLLGRSVMKPEVWGAEGLLRCGEG